MDCQAHRTLGPRAFCRIAPGLAAALVALGCHRSPEPPVQAVAPRADAADVPPSTEAMAVVADLRERVPPGLAAGFVAATGGGLRPRFRTTSAGSTARLLLPGRSTEPMRLEDEASG